MKSKLSLTEKLRWKLSLPEDRSFLTIILSLLAGMLIVSFIIWNRVIRELLPTDIVGEIYSLRFWINLCLCTWGLFLITMLSRKLYKRVKGIETYGYIIRQIQLLSPATKDLIKKYIIRPVSYFITHVIESPKFLWVCIYNAFPKKFRYVVQQVCFTTCAFVLNNVFTFNRKYPFREIIAIFLFVYFPRIFCFSIFLYEIAINKRLDFFYTVAPLLLIPLFFRSFRWICQMTLVGRLKSLEKINIQGLTYTEEGNMKVIMLPTCTDYQQFKKDALIYSHLWRLLQLVNHINEVDNFYADFESLVVCVLLMLSFFIWLLVIIQIL
jgi:hypothetical protein